MGRDTGSEQITLSQKDIFRRIILMKLALDSGDVLACSLDRNVDFDDGGGIQTYLGVGNFGKISSVKESSTAGANGISLELSGIPPQYINVAKNEEYHGRNITIRHGFVDANFKITTATGDPAVIFKGKIDQMFIALGETATITLTAENDWIRWEEPFKSLFTNEEQQFLYPGDLGLEFVNQVVNKELIWGRT
jgi:hypothetical protein